MKREQGQKSCATTAPSAWYDDGDFVVPQRCTMERKKKGAKRKKNTWSSFFPWEKVAEKKRISEFRGFVVSLPK